MITVWSSHTDGPVFLKCCRIDLVFHMSLFCNSGPRLLIGVSLASWHCPPCLQHFGDVTHAPYPSDKQAHFMDEHLKRPNIRHVCTSDGVENVGNEHKNKAILGVGREYQIWVSSLWNRVYTHNWPSPIYPFSICTDIYAPLVKQIGLCKHNILFGMACTRTLWYNCCIHSF